MLTNPVDTGQVAPPFWLGPSSLQLNPAVQELALQWPDLLLYWIWDVCDRMGTPIHTGQGFITLYGRPHPQPQPKGCGNIQQLGSGRDKRKDRLA